MNFVILLVLIPPAIEDIKTREIRNLYFVIIAILRCIQLFIEKDRDLLVEALLGAFVAITLMLLCTLINKGGIGAGDIKLLASLGFAYGIRLFLSGLFFVSLCSILFSVFLLATKKASRDMQIPFVPFIFMGMLVATLIEAI